MKIRVFPEYSRYMRNETSCVYTTVTESSTLHEIPDSRCDDIKATWCLFFFILLFEQHLLCLSEETALFKDKNNKTNKVTKWPVM